MLTTHFSKSNKKATSPHIHNLAMYPHVNKARQLSVVQDEEFQNILQYGETSKCKMITEDDLKFEIRESYNTMMAQIEAELQQGKRISTKLDFAKRFGRHFLGVGVQYQEDGVIKNRLIQCSDVAEAHTSVNIKEMIKKSYDRCKLQKLDTIAHVTDTARPMKKAMWLLNEDLTESAIEELAKEGENDEENWFPEDAEQHLADYGIATDQDCVCHVIQLSI